MVAVVFLSLRMPASPPPPSTTFGNFSHRKQITVNNMDILMSQDITRSTLPKKEFHELAEELLNRFPRADRAILLKDLTARYFLDMKYGCKREERAACEFLNLLQRSAVRLSTLERK
jgi:hypothetical protein